MISDLSGQKFPRSQMRKNYRGAWVHVDEWEPRPRQERVQGRTDNLHRGVFRPGTGDNAD